MARKQVEKPEQIAVERPEKDPDEGQGHEQIETDEFDDEFSRNYWKICKQDGPKRP